MIAEFRFRSTGTRRVPRWEPAHCKHSHETVPEAPKGLFVSLQFKGYSAASRKQGVATLAKEGYLGCYPLGDASGAEIVVRLQPTRPFGDSSVAIATPEIHGTTFSPDILHWVAARIAFIKQSTITARYDAATESELIAYAEHFGGAEPARRVLQVLAKLGRAKYVTRI